MIRLTLFSIMLSVVSLIDAMSRKTYLNSPPVTRWKHIPKGTDEEQFKRYKEVRTERDNLTFNQPLKN